MKNIKDTIFSQYAHSPALLGIITSLNDTIDPEYFIDDFYEYVYRLSTAKGFGLDIWANRVGVSRNAPMYDTSIDAFGFEVGFEPFNTFPFNGGISNSSYQLPDELLRKVIIFKAASNIIYATALNINQMLLTIFEGRRAYYRISGHMQAEYVFEFVLTPFERTLVYNFNILPKPCGVEISYKEISVNSLFGFEGTGLQNFDHGGFQQ